MKNNRKNLTSFKKISPLFHIKPPSAQVTSQRHTKNHETVPLYASDFFSRPTAEKLNKKIKTKLKQNNCLIFIQILLNFSEQSTDIIIGFKLMTQPHAIHSCLHSTKMAEKTKFQKKW